MNLFFTWITVIYYLKIPKIKPINKIIYLKSEFEEMKEKYPECITWQNKPSRDKLLDKTIFFDFETYQTNDMRHQEPYFNHIQMYINGEAYDQNHHRK